MPLQVNEILAERLGLDPAVQKVGGDLTVPFAALPRMLEAIDLADVNSRGYAFQVEMTYRAIEAGFTVVEVPIVFRDRAEGDSKMSRAIVAEAVWRVPAMRLRRRRRP